MKSTLFTSLVWLLFLGAASDADCDLIVNIPDLNMVAGSTTTIDIQISETAPFNSLKAYNYTLRLTPLVATSTVRFVNPQSEAQTTNGSYVLSGNSNAITDGNPITTVSTVMLPNDTVSGVDITNSGTVTVGGTPKLLATFDLLHFVVGDPSLTIGNTFQLELISSPASATQFLDGANALIPFTSNLGTITITAAAVPEPSSWGLLSLVGLCIAISCSIGQLRSRQATGIRERLLSTH